MIPVPTCQARKAETDRVGHRVCFNLDRTDSCRWGSQLSSPALALAFSVTAGLTFQRLPKAISMSTSVCKMGRPPGSDSALHVVCIGASTKASAN